MALSDVDNVQIVGIALVGSLLGLITLLYLTFKRVLNQDAGTPRMQEIAEAIQEGAAAFLQKEYSYLTGFVLLMTVLIGVATRDAGHGWTATVPSFLLGAALSAGCGYFGMYIAVRANVRTAAAARVGLNDALKVSFASGGVMGLSCVSLGLLGLIVVFVIFGDSTNSKIDTAYLAGFGFGASTIALFARVGGGIFTKAADVGADLVGKVEAGIPEDDPRNPATIADNVGDNVGDVAGMGADLFESFVGSIIAATQLAGIHITAATEAHNNEIRQRIALPFWIAGFGILSSVIGIFVVRTKDNVPQSALQDVLLGSIRTGIVVASVISAGLSLLSCGIIFGWDNTVTYDLWGCVIIGLIAGVLIGEITEYATSFAYGPTQNIAKKSLTGAATVIIQGLGVGNLSTLPPVVVVVAAIIATFELASVYGIAIAAVGMLSTLGVTLATDAFGPVADNAGGIAEMAELDEEVRVRTDGLDALGNTTAATGKGFAIGSAALTALALLSAYSESANVTQIDVKDAYVLSGTLIGACLPFVFAALTMLAVGRSAGSIIYEVRRQFREIRGIMEGEQRPDYAQCVRISTTAALIEMVVPGVIAVFAPLIIGFMLGPEALGGLLVGSLTAGFMLAVSMANAGGAWDNAKKWVEAGGLGTKEEGLGKGSEFHAATVIGDTVGDPFKDTSGPALNILIKLMTMFSLVFAPVFTSNGVPRAPWDSETTWVGILLLVVVSVFCGAWSYRFRNFQQISFEEAVSSIKTAPASQFSDEVDIPLVNDSAV